MATKSSILKRKLNSMSTTTTKKRRRRKPSASTATPRRRRRTTSTRRKKRALSDGRSRSKFSLMKTGQNTIAGGLGGAVYTAPKFFVKLPLWGKIAWGLGGSIAMQMMGMPNAGAGQAGAMFADLAQSTFSTALKDGDLEDTEYVDSSTLSDTGMTDEQGNPVVMDDDGVVYALNDGGDYQAIGMASDFDLQDEMQQVSMVPLEDAYALKNPYDLQ